MFANIIFLLCLFLAASSFGANCAHSCHIFNLEDNTPSVIASPADFTSVGGYSKELNTSCVARVGVRGEILTFTVNDVFGDEVVLSIRKGSKLISASNFSGGYGSLSHYGSSVKLTCRK